MDVADAELSGYAELRAGYQLGVAGVPWGLNERIRPSLTIEPTDRIKVNATVEARFYQGRSTEEELVALLEESAIGETLAEYCTYAPDEPYDEIGDYLTVERLYAKFNLPAVDLTVGRQAVNWGSALAFHPTDVYAELIVTEPWRERAGVNAVRAHVPFGNHSATALVALGDDFSEIGEDEPEFEEIPVSAAGRLTFNALQTDWSAVGYVRADGDWFAGADLRGNLEVGWWIEGGWHGDSDSVEVAAGLDYSFAVLQLLYVAAEYRYDGSGSAPEDYDWEARSAASSIPYDCAFLPEPAEPRATLGRHYVDGVVRLGITEDLSVQNVVIANVEDGTGVLVPNATLLVGSHVSLNLGAQIAFGEDGEYRPPQSVLEREIAGETIDFSGQVPDATLLAWARYSF